ncbi:MAG: hypothetical protein U1C46_07790, partial [Bacteroidales bacterium]|nr:hypothetical protein [Bacteroidales bacterium]
MKKYLIPLILGVIGTLLILLNYLLPIASTGELNVRIQPTSYIMPAAYKVYANEEALSGRFYLCKILITNESSSALENLEVSYEIPGFIDKNKVDKIKYL